MSRFIESIQIKDGQILNLSYHNQRFNNTRKDFYSDAPTLNLEDYCLIPVDHKQGIFKCRIIYTQVIERIEFRKYQLSSITSLQMVVDNQIDYKYKNTDREHLKSLFLQKNDADDILIIQNGLLTDSYYCNVALLKDDQWFTPKAPLLKGTKRSYLLENQVIFEADIPVEGLRDYSEIRLFNAMIPWGAVAIPISSIRQL